MWEAYSDLAKSQMLSRGFGPFLTVTNSKSADLCFPCLPGVTQHRQAKPTLLQMSPLLSSRGASSPLGWGDSTQPCQGWGGQPASCPCWACGSGRVAAAAAQAVSCRVSRDGTTVCMLAAGCRVCTVGEEQALGLLQHAHGLTPLLNSWKLTHVSRASGNTFYFSHL